MTNQIAKEGQKMQGKYCGFKFSGIIESMRFNEACRNQIFYTVRLDQTINVFGEPRESVIINSDKDEYQVA